MANLTNSDIIKGSAMQIWLGEDTAPVAFATEHSFSINVLLYLNVSLGLVQLLILFVMMDC